MHLDIVALVGLAFGLPVALGLAAARWGVDSRFRDVRSDFV